MGPLKAIDFKVPTTATENLFIRSVDSTTDQYQTLVDELRVGPIHLINRNCDTGKPTLPAKYALTDGAYAQLLHHLSLRNFDLLTPALKDDIANYYSDLNAPFATKKSTDGWQITLQELGKLRAADPSGGADPSIQLKQARRSRLETGGQALPSAWCPPSRFRTDSR